MGGPRGEAELGKNRKPSQRTVHIRNKTFDTGAGEVVANAIRNVSLGEDRSHGRAPKNTSEDHPS